MSISNPRSSRTAISPRRRITALNGSFALALAWAGASYAQAPSQAPPSSMWTSPWGGQLVPEGMPLAPRQPIVQKAPPSTGGLTRPTPALAASLPLARAEPASAAAPAPMAAVEPLYLDHLQAPDPPEVRLAGLAEDTVAPMSEVLAEPQPPLPPGARDGVFQKIFVTGTWLPPLADEPDALGVGSLESGIVLGFPFMRRDTPLLVTPQFGAHFLDNAVALDIPTTLYDASLEFRHLRKFGAGPWAMDVAATIGYYSDFEQDSGDALRVSGRGIGVYESSAATKWLLGVAYLNRAGASVLPVFGVIHEPSPDLRLDLVFPRPRVSWRTAASATGDERWLYLGGEFGGGVWSITRPSSGELDLINYSDWRLLAGYERKVIGGLTRRFEVGYVFQRELEYESTTPDATLDDTLFGRIGLSY
jgi:hypothetical protein